MINIRHQDDELIAIHLSVLSVKTCVSDLKL